MERKKIGEDCERLRELDATALTEQCAKFVAEHSDQIAKARPAIPDSLNDRAADIWEPLLALADIAGGDWPAKARAAAEGLNARAHDSNPIASLFLDIMFLFLRDDRERIFTKDILQALNWKRDRPWSELRRGKELTDMWLSQKLRPYGVKPRTMRIGDELGKGYAIADLIEVFQRYVSRSEYESFKAELKERAEAQRELQDQTQKQEPHDDVAHGTQARSY